MSILRIKDNHQLRIALKYPSPKDAPRRNGGPMEYIYTLSNGDAMFLPPLAHQEIQSLKPLAGEFFTLAKLVGDDNAVSWSVERIPGEPIPAPIHKPMAAARTITPSPGIPIPPSLTTPESRRIFTQLVATLQGCQAAEAFAESIGYPMKFDSQDIRAMTISGFIEQSRRAA